MKLLLCNLVAILICITEISAQESARILLMNGKVLDVIQLDDSTQTVLTYRYDKNYFKRERINLKVARKLDLLYTADFTSPKGNEVPIILREGQMVRDEVFAIRDSSGNEKLLYAYDEIKGNYLTQEQMRAFVVGERDARISARGQFWFYTGLATGVISGYAFKSSLYALAFPPLFALTAQIPTIHIKDRHISDSMYLNNEDYASGYASYARSKYTREALKGSVLGTVIGIVAYAIVDNNR